MEESKFIEYANVLRSSYVAVTAITNMITKERIKLMVSEAEDTHFR